MASRATAELCHVPADVGAIAARFEPADTDEWWHGAIQRKLHGQPLDRITIRHSPVLTVGSH